MTAMFPYSLYTSFSSPEAVILSVSNKNMVLTERIAVSGDENVYTYILNVDKKGKKERKETLFKCLDVQALNH